MAHQGNSGTNIVLKLEILGNELFYLKNDSNLKFAWYFQTRYILRKTRRTAL